MAIPDYQTIMLPLLKLVASRGTMPSNQMASEISDQFGLSPTERAELLPSGKQEIIKNRVGWAKTYMVKAGLLTSPKRGVVSISDRGKQVLASNPPTINVAFLKQFPEFQEFQSIGIERTSDISSKTKPVSLSEQTPDDLIEAAYTEFKSVIVDELLTKIKSSSPAFFERLVVDVMVAMGYGGSHAEARQVVGGSGDEGIDGIIKEDRLGLDVIYLQAKRWEGNVSRPEIQKFAGALQGKKAKKGIFITTSDFTNEAKEFAKSIDAKIVLVSGRQLADLMLEHKVGVSVTNTYEMKEINQEYFDEDFELGEK